MQVEYLDDQPDYGIWREELTTQPAFLRGEVRQEVFVDEAEGIAGELPGQWRDDGRDAEGCRDDGFHTQA